ncbi:MAG: 50S ribosomal protein L10 [Acidobacteriia bacterium 12-62-4]|nr:MAG: 50S ribosomal protein L10 [Acidobacteriia bacterium 12-62-4]
MKKKADKAKDLAFLRGEFEQTGNIFLTGYEKMTVSQDYNLRKTIKEAGGSYKVVKNNLAQKASEGLKSEALFSKVVGMSAVAYTKGDVVALAKALTGYAKTVPAFTFKAGLVEGNVVDVKSIADLAALPAKEEIYAKLLFLIQAPAQRVVTVTNAVGRNLAVVIDQGVKENKFQA